jgi:hypothetical protein
MVAGPSAKVLAADGRSDRMKQTLSRGCRRTVEWANLAQFAARRAEQRRPTRCPT